ncbi:hypothetical protein HMN09_00846400 [Mycena chlorophos]|uniref:Uncharacterized protein n=1 Tax=Mycena chlorophos TaxID=658473 RepID=A0A8H6W4B3_MYCCL|nr:hypothetical protein HMN09_00846400 [Mycena chlorophos]
MQRGKSEESPAEAESHKFGVGAVRTVRDTAPKVQALGQVGLGSSGREQEYGAKVVSKAGKLAKKAVGFITPKKSTARGRISDTPRTTRSAAAAAGSLRSAQSSQASACQPGNSGFGPKLVPICPSPIDVDAIGSDRDSDIEVLDDLTAEEKDRKALDKARATWTSHIYAFYHPDVELTTKDATSTKNLTTHAHKCWGKELVDAARDHSLKDARNLLRKHNGSRLQKLTNIFKNAATGGAETYSTVPMTRAETRRAAAAAATDGAEDGGDEDDGGGLADLDDLLAELHDLERSTPERDDDEDVFDEVAAMMDDDRETFIESTKEIRAALTKRLFSLPEFILVITGVTDEVRKVRMIVEHRFF